MPEYIDSELKEMLMPPSVKMMEIRGKGEDKRYEITDAVENFVYVITTGGIFPMTLKQKSFYEWCVISRDSGAAAHQVGVTLEQAKKWLSDSRAMDYILGRVEEEGHGSRLTKSALDAKLSKGLNGEEEFTKNKVKLLELGMKRSGMLIERKQFDFEDGTEIVFGLKKEAGQK